MHFRLSIWGLAVLLVASALSAQGDKGRTLAEQFAQVHALVKSSPGEARWDEIEWTTSLWEARKRAAATGKPLFIWAANGHPLGVT